MSSNRIRNENETDCNLILLDILIKIKEKITVQEILIPVNRKIRFSGHT